MLGKRFQQQSNKKFAQLHYFLSQNVGGDKIYYVPPVQNMSPHKLGPWPRQEVLLGLIKSVKGLTIGPEPTVYRPLVFTISRPLLYLLFYLQLRSVKANLHSGVARSSRTRFFVCFIAPRSCPAEPCMSAELPDTTKLTIPQCRLALTFQQAELNKKEKDKMRKVINEQMLHLTLCMPEAPACSTLPKTSRNEILE